jgi:hypothetical protein
MGTRVKWAILNSILNRYVMRGKNGVLCAAACRLAAERNETDKPAKVYG